MAQIRAAGTFWAGADLLAAALSKAFAAKYLARNFGHACGACDCRNFETALVSRLSFIFDAAGICHQQNSWLHFADAVFHFHFDAHRLDFAMGGKNSLQLKRPREAKTYWREAKDCGKRFLLVFSIAAVVATNRLRGETVIADVFARQVTSLNGKWNVIVDPYDMGYFNYRLQPYDADKKPTGGFFLDHKPADKTELIEYNFDKSPTIKVPGDWNSQDEKLFYYEGSVWYRKGFDCKRITDGHRLFIYFRRGKL